jgi:hypothetical protein
MNVDRAARFGYVFRVIPEFVPLALEGFYFREQRHRIFSEPAKGWGSLLNADVVITCQPAESLQVNRKTKASFQETV